MVPAGHVRIGAARVLPAREAAGGLDPAFHLLPAGPHGELLAGRPARQAGPLQYGSGLQAFIINLLVAHMLSLRRTVGLLNALTGLRLSEQSVP